MTENLLTGTLNIKPNKKSPLKINVSHCDLYFMILSILRIPTMIINILFKNRKRKVSKNLEHELLFIPAMLSWDSTDNIRRLNCFDI